MNEAKAVLQALELLQEGLVLINQRVDSLEAYMNQQSILDNDMAMTLKRIISNVSSEKLEQTSNGDMT